MVPGFLMATLNPGGKTRRRKKRLTTWQREVKRAGGVMQAVRARRSRKAGRRRRRKNPFLTTAKAAAAPLFNAGRRRRKNRTRRSAVSRRRLRSRSRKSLGRRPKMARVRHRRRRRVSRGAGGRFKSARRSHRRRRTRRNPVVPVSWNPRRKRRRSRRRNPLFLTRRGRFSGRGGHRRLHMRRRRPRHWHNNPVVPVSWNPRKRRHSRRRGYRRNPVLPFFAMNPGGSGPVGEILGRLKSMVDVSFWTETALPVAAGFFGSKVIGNRVYNLIPVVILQNVPSVVFPFIRSATNALSGAGMSYLAGKFLSKKVADGIWTGTIVGVASDMLKQLLDAFAPGMSASLGLSGLGQSSLSERMKEAVTERVKHNMGSYLNTRNLRHNTARPVNGMGATYATVRMANSTYDPSPRMNMSDYEVANDSTQL